MKRYRITGHFPMYSVEVREPFCDWSWKDNTLTKWGAKRKIKKLKNPKPKRVIWEE